MIVLKQLIVFYDRIEETFTIIAEYPRISTAFNSKDTRLAKLRWFPVKDFPKHLVFYMADEQQITIVRVLHASQNISKILS